jgi:hypothetical protein
LISFSLSVLDAKHSTSAAVWHRKAGDCGGWGMARLHKFLERRSASMVCSADEFF